ncbi:MAG: DUF4235 domain-containing protein [Solirubrobacterales bacterium]
MDNDLVKKLMWSALTTIFAAGAAIIGRKAAEQVWVRAMGEEPPTD